MPIPSREETSGCYVRVDIHDEVIRAKIVPESRCSLVSKTFLSTFEQYWAYNYLVNLPIRCNENFGYVNFLIMNGNTSEDLILGSDLLRRFEIEK